MAEQHQRCRFWPHCEIHRGVPSEWGNGVKLYSDAQVQEMREEHAAGATYEQIAIQWHTTAPYVWHLIKRTRRGQKLDLTQNAPPAG